MPAEIELSQRTNEQYEGGADAKPRKLNPMEKKREKHKEKLGSWNIREASDIGESVINLDRAEKTDPVFCILLLLVFVATIGLAIFGFVGGGTVAYAPFLADGTQCGHAAGTMRGTGASAQDGVGFPYLYFPVPKDGESTVESYWDEAVCLSACPVGAALPTGDVLGTPSSKFKSTDASGWVAYETIRIGLLCKPTEAAKSDKQVAAASSAIWGDIKKTAGGQKAISAMNSGKSLAICMVTAGILSILYIYAMANFAKCIAYTVIFIIELWLVVILLAGLAMSSGNAERVAASAVKVATSSNPVLTCATSGQMSGRRQLQGQGKQGNPGMGLVAFGAVGLLVFNVVLYCKWKQIKIAIAVVDATADFFVATKRINLVGIMYFLLMTLWAVFWFACVIAMSGIGYYEWQGKNSPTHQGRKMVTGKDPDADKRVQYIMYFMIFSFLWIVLWLKESNVFVLMSSVSMYYFDSGPSKEGQAQVGKAIKWAHVVHTGSIALGSFIHTILLLTVYPLMYYADTLSESNNPATKCCGYALKCCLKCIEDLVEYLNKVAYAYMAITGNKYCSSAWNGFLLNIKHLCQFYLTIQLAEGFIKLGVGMIVLCNIAIFTGLHIFAFNESGYATPPPMPASIGNQDECTALYNLYRQYLSESAQTIGKSIVASVIAYLMLLAVTFLVIEIFLGLFDEAVVSTLHCMACDMELNDGRPKFGPPSFHEKMNEILGDPDLDNGVEKGADPEANLADQTNQPMNAPPPQGQPMMAPGQPMGQPMMMGGGMQTHTMTTTTTTTQQQQVIQ